MPKSEPLLCPNEVYKVASRIKPVQKLTGVHILAMLFLTVFGSYVASSIIFLRYPHLLRKKKKVKFRARHISHRGGKQVVLSFFLTSAAL